MADKVTLTFNGREVQAEAGTPLIQLSQELGEEIPHFCYHPGIGVDGNCRMCLVELKGAPKLVPGCTLKVAEGMEVTSDSEKVIKAREGVLEFILINHPLDCPICDKGGECPLQETTRAHGPGHSRMADPKNTAVKHRVIGEHIIFDAERCILCSRCVRYQRDVVGREELFLRMRGDHVMVDIFEDQPLTSGFTGNLADICPVGALTTREFRFKARPWEMRAAETVCGGCSLHCSMRAWWKGDDLQRLTANVDHDVNDWWLCDKGRFGYPRQSAAAEQLVQRQGVQVPVPADEAAARARELLAGASHPRIVAGSRATDEELAALGALASALGAPSPYPAGAAELDFHAALAESRLELGSLAGLARFARAVVLGEDPELAHPILALRLGGGAQEPGVADVTLVHDGEFAPKSELSRRWTRETSAVAAWLGGAGKTALAGDDALLVAVAPEAVRGGAVTPALLDALAQRKGETAVLWLQPGMNRRGLLDAAARGGGGLRPEALESGGVDVVLAFGVDAGADFDDPARWGRALERAGALILQSTDPDAARAAAAVVLARRAPVDLAGTVTNSFGRRAALRTWSPVAGRRAQDIDWFEPLLAASPTDTLEVAGS